jgi:segregation and condensation protein A
MIQYLKGMFEQMRPDEPLFILRVLEQQRTRRAMITLFLAVLEMVKIQAVRIVQKDLFGEIALRRHEMFDTVLASGQPIPALEKDYS